MKSKEFNALIIDASADNLYVMLLSQGKVLGGKKRDSIKKHSETVMTEIDRVLKLGGLKAWRRGRVCLPGWAAAALRDSEWQSAR